MNPHKLPFVGKLRRSVKSLRRLDERGLLYEMEYTADYRIFMKLIEKLVSSSGCSTMFAATPEGEPILCRNYDFSHYRYGDSTDKTALTGLNIVLHVNNPHVKYRSLGVVDGYWLDAKGGHFFEGSLEDGKTDISLMALLPFICMDGMNTAGLAVSIMYLSCPVRWDEVEYRDPETLTEKEKKSATILETAGELPSDESRLFDHGDLTINTADRRTWVAFKHFSTCQKQEGRKTMYHPVLMRRMLDECATVEEAIEAAKGVNIKSPMPDSDYHILLADASGKSVMLEWIDNELKVIPASHGTNFYLGKDCPYCGGRDRDEILADALESHPEGMTEEEGRKVLEEVSQDRRIGKYIGFTQWSAVYNLVRKTMKLWVHMDYGKCYEFKL